MPALSGPLLALTALMGVGAMAQRAATRRRTRALSPQRGQIWRPTEIGLLWFFFPLLFNHQRLDAWLTQGGAVPFAALIFCLPFWASAALRILQPEGPVAWTPERLTGPAPGLRGYRHRIAIGWNEITRITRDGPAYPWNGDGWVVWAADGRTLYFHPDHPGHETLIAALRHYRPDLDTGTPTY